MALKLIDTVDPRNPLQTAYVQTFAASTPLMGAMRVETAPKGVYEVEREANLGTTAFRSLNEAYDASEGSDELVKFYTRIAGGDVQVDKGIIRRRGERARSSSEAKKIKSLAHLFDHKIVNGDNRTSSKEFDGLKTIFAGSSQELENSGSAAALSLVKLDEAIEMCEGATHILMDRRLKILLSASTRATGVSGYLRHDRDDFGRPISIYNDLPILVSDPMGHSNPALTGLQEAGTSTSLYVLNLSGDEASTVIIQIEDMEVTDLGEMDSAPKMATRVEWDAGIAVKSPRGVVRLKNVNHNAVTA